MINITIKKKKKKKCSYLKEDDESQSRCKDAPVLFGEVVRIGGPGGFPVVLIPGVGVGGMGVYFIKASTPLTFKGHASLFGFPFRYPLCSNHSRANA